MLSREEIDKKLHNQEKFLWGYGSRIAALIDTCTQNNILPVFITQPCLYGTGKGSVTGVNLATAKVEESMNGSLLAELIGLYNERMKDVGKQKSIQVIDLAGLLHKNSLYYYDQTHYTNQGAAIIGRLLGEKMKRILAGRY